MSSDLTKKMRGALARAVKGLRAFAYARQRAEPAAVGSREKRRIGLALGGGFARGLAHIGVLKVLQENDIPVAALAGTSVGSIIAAAYASGMTVEEMTAETQRIRWKSFARWTVDRLGLATNERMTEMLRRVLRCGTFEELSIPLAVVAADLTTGEAVTFRQGELIPPLRASCSFPGLFVPIEYQGRLLVDGAIVRSVPVTALEGMGVNTLVAVYLRSDGPRHTPTNIFQVVGQSFQIAQSLNQATWREPCDLVIEPETADFKWDDFARAEELIRAGERAAREALPALLALTEPRPAGSPHQLVAH